MAVARESRLQNYGNHFVVYNFDNAGDVLPVHTHEVAHLAIVVAGKFRFHNVHGDITVGPVHMIDIHPPHPHGFTALEPNSILVNVFRGGDKK